MRGQSATSVHTDITSLGNDLLDFASGKFLLQYFTDMSNKHNKGRKDELLIPTIINADDPNCITVQSFRSSSSTGEVFRLLQRFVKTEYYSSKPGDKGGCERIEITFWTIAKKEVPVEVNVESTITTNKKIIDDSYSERGNFRLTNKLHSQTSLIYNVEIAFNSESYPLTLPSLYRKLLYVLGIVQSANTYYDRSEKVDEAFSNHLVKTTMTTSPELTEKEKHLIDSSLLLAEKRFIRIPGTLRKDLSIEMFHVLSSTDSAWGKAVGIIDTSAETCFSWIWDWTSNERMAEHERKNGNVLRVAYRIPNSHSEIVSAVMKMPTGFANRVFHGWFVWSKIPDYNGHETLVIAFAPREDCDIFLLPPLPSFQNETNIITGKTFGIYIIEKLAPQVTRLTLIQQANMGGKIPKFLTDLSVSNSVGNVQRVVHRFKRNGKLVDKEMRKSFISKIKHAPKLTSDQQHLVDRCLKMDDVGNGEFTEIE